MNGWKTEGPGPCPPSTLAIQRNTPSPGMTWDFRWKKVRTTGGGFNRCRDRAGSHQGGLTFSSVFISDDLCLVYGQRRAIGGNKRNMVPKQPNIIIRLIRPPRGSLGQLSRITSYLLIYLDFLTNLVLYDNYLNS